ncbi:hypothetical protein [Argonema antarcticum]|uniref:hypothetical protein n=1 Tax=Argonema antarcticum TaxID=2942763 RepID=UPI002013BA4C|nr:hypothetical protein [Argonema antarcticum]MCL1474418.1 hypothetical protein [Argonema antarcticum A004/B2]
MTQNNLQHAINLKYSAFTGKLAGGIAKEIHQSLDAEVIRQLAGMAEKDAAITANGARLGDYLRRWHWRSKLTIFAVAGSIGISIAAALIPSSQLLRVGLVGSSATLYALGKASKKTSDETLAIASVIARMEAAQSVLALAQMTKPMPYQQTVAAIASVENPKSEIEVLNPEQIIEEATGIGLLGNSGSGKTCIAKLLASAMGDCQILVLDPHDDPEKTNWSGLHVVRSYDLIVQQLELLLTLLDDHDRTPLVIIADEWPAVRMWCKQQGLDIADRFLLRFGSEARKFDKLPIFCSQSGNVKALGLEGMGDFLENFLLIRLHRVALKYAKNLSDRTVAQHCQSVAYPCLVGELPVIHPTHGHHQRFYKGAPPQRLNPLRSLPLSIPLVE